MKGNRFIHSYLYFMAILMVIGLIGCRNSQSTKTKDKDSGIQNETSLFQGRWIEGTGNQEILELIDQAFESMQPSSQMANLPLLYKRDWDGFVEATNWPCWWIQNSFGPSYGVMPFLQEPYATWLEHSQALWFRLMGDGRAEDAKGFIAPDGCLCDAAGVYLNGGEMLGFGDPRTIGRYSNPKLDGSIHNEWVVFRQGDGEVEIHDWFIGATAAGLILEAERLLVRHNSEKARERLPQLQRVAAFLDSRRDPETNLLKAGRAANLLAPAYKGYTNPDGNPEFAYLTELSVNYAAGLARLAEVCDMIGNNVDAENYRQTAENIKSALPKLMDEKGSFIMSLDPDGTKHGVFGADKHGYFEATPNHDAVCMGVVDDEASKRIIQRMVSIPELAPHDLILPNFPSYDDHSGEGNMTYGTWVNGGHWTTTQGRMNIACLRVNEFEHPFNSWKKISDAMKGFRADAPRKELGAVGWFNGRFPYDIVYDCWGAPAGLLRGLFEYDYRANNLRVRPHLPSDISSYTQKWPVMFGKTKVYLTVTGSGAVKSAIASGREYQAINGWINLNMDGKRGNLLVEIICGDAVPRGAWEPETQPALVLPEDPAFWQIPEKANSDKRHVDMKKVYSFYQELIKAEAENCYEAAQARSSLEILLARQERIQLLDENKLIIPDLAPIVPCDQDEVNLHYFEKARIIAGGLVDRLNGYSVWGEHPDPEIVEIARKTKLVR
ncbi:hypothetical protein N9164_02585 [Draconibacterium sp.]|nr:hypothetical protein [Draconibacterium sp.]